MRNKMQKNKSIFWWIFLVTVILLQSVLLANEKQEIANQEVVSYFTTFYGKQNGLESKNFNAITQTEEGYIWVGGYGGLFCYDGVSFERKKLGDGIVNISCLYTDTKNRLWIGTNDSGLYCYDQKNNVISKYGTNTGFTSLYIYTIAESGDGILYVGAGDGLYLIFEDESVKKIENTSDISCQVSLEYNAVSDAMVGVTKSGTLFAVRGEEILQTERLYDKDSASYYCAANKKNGEICIGITNGMVEICTFDGENFQRNRKVYKTEFAWIDDIYIDEEKDSMILLGDTGMGMIDNKGKFTVFDTEKIKSLAKKCMVDAQGNYWAVSDGQGICKVSRSKFTNIFEELPINISGITTITSFQGDLFIGGYEGLVILDEKTMQPKRTEIAEKFRGVRIRCMMPDTKGNLWFSTYSRIGLICMNSYYQFSYYNVDNSKIESQKFRSTIELPDGTIVAATAEGVNYIKDGEVICELGKADGINAQILAMAIQEDGSVVAGSDGDGVYIIKDKKIIKAIRAQEGLTSQVVLRVARYEQGYLYATGAGIFYDDGSHENIEKLNRLPAIDVLDMKITDSKQLWTLTNSELIIADIEDVIANKKDYPYLIYDSYQGLDTSIIANAWNYIDSNGNLFFCTADGVKKISMNLQETNNIDYKIAISKVVVDQKEIFEENGVYTIPKCTHRVSVKPAILNYSTENPKVRMYLNRFDDMEMAERQSELTEISYTNLPMGLYKMHIQILSSNNEEVLYERIFSFYKQGYFYEHLWFKCLIVIGSLIILSMLGYVMVNSYINNKVRIEREKTLSFLSYNDELTGAFNRHALDERADQLPCHSLVGVAFGDVMGLKLVNDTQGHDAGDRLIIKAYQIATEIFGKENVYRIGGDEFVMLLTNVSESEIKEKTKQLIDRTQEEKAEMALGYAWTHDYNGKYSELQKIADDKMYAYKKKRYADTGYVRSHV